MTRRNGSLPIFTALKSNHLFFTKLEKNLLTFSLYSKADPIISSDKTECICNETTLFTM